MFNVNDRVYQNYFNAKREGYVVDIKNGEYYIKWFDRDYVVTYRFSSIKKYHIFHYPKYSIDNYIESKIKRTNKNVP